MASHKSAAVAANLAAELHHEVAARHVGSAREFRVRPAQTFE